MEDKSCCGKSKEKKKTEIIYKCSCATKNENYDIESIDEERVHLNMHESNKTIPLDACSIKSIRSQKSVKSND